jgi:hypothetical protein
MANGNGILWKTGTARMEIGAVQAVGVPATRTIMALDLARGTKESERRLLPTILQRLLAQFRIAHPIMVGVG